MTPQAREVFEVLKKGRTLTPLIASTTMGVFSLTSRISEIRRSTEAQEYLEVNGQVLSAANKRDNKGKLYKEYSLQDKE